MRIPLLFGLLTLLPSLAWADLAQTQQLLANRPGKIVARNNAEGGTLWLLELDSGAKRKLSDEINCSGPLLSPDGTRVTYHQNGAVFIQPLDGSPPAKLLDGYDPHFWIDGSGDEWIYYTTSGNFSTATRKLWWPDANGVKTYRYRLKDGQEELVVDWKASGGPSKDGKMIAAGYATMILFEEGGQANLLNNSTQGCNASMYPGDNAGGTYFLMHLELPHDTFCYRDKDDNRVWHVLMPEGTEEWQNPEWSNHPDYCMATAKESNSYYGAWVIKISDIDGSTGLIKSGAQGMAKALPTQEGDWAEPYLWLAESAPAPPPTEEDAGAPNPDVDAGTTDSASSPPPPNAGDGGVPASQADAATAQTEGGAQSGLSGTGPELAGGCSTTPASIGTLPWLLLALLALWALHRRRQAV